jgi:GMP synthase (glutamine-hydrolysing)
VAPEPPGRIADALREQNVSHRIVRIFDGDRVPETLGDASGLVVMGGPMGVGDAQERPHLRAECALIEAALQHGHPVLGVCLGSQLLAHVLGADVHPGPTMELGWHDLTLTQAAANDPLWHDVTSPLPAFHWHGDVFDLPKGAVSLAHSKQTAHQAFRHGRAAYGFLFHLEMTPPLIAQMTRTFPGDVDAAGADGAAIREVTSRHMDTLAPVAQRVFRRWAAQVALPPS